MNLSSKHLQELLKKDAQGVHVSIYLPTHPSSNSQSLVQDITRFKNALKEVKSSPVYDESELGGVLKSLYDLAEDVKFWKKQDVGLALFANSSGFDYCHLPYEVTEATYVKDKFVISPLVIMHSIGAEFYVLDINLTKPRLLKSNHGTFELVNEDDMPSSFQNTVERDEYGVGLQNMPAPRGSGGDNRVHGHSSEDIKDHDVAKYLRSVASSVNKFLADQDYPLLLVGEQSRMGNLRPYLKYEYLLSQSIEGNFESSNLQDLYNLTIKAIQKHDSEARRSLVERLTSSDPGLVATGNKNIIEAAQAGRVERIFLPSYRRTTDSVRPGGEVSIILQLPSKIDDLELIIENVLAHAGSVVAIEIGAYPELVEIKALCRF